MTSTRFLILSLLIALLGLSFESCEGTGYTFVSREGFTAVSPDQLPPCNFLVADYPVRVSLHLGEATRVVFPEDLPKEIRDDLELRVKDSILLIASKGLMDRSSFWNTVSDKDIRLEVYLPSLHGLEATQASTIQLMDSVQVSSFSAVAEGASSISGLRLVGDSLAVAASGASQVDAQVALGKQLLVMVSGASHVGVKGTSPLTQISVDGASGCDARAMSSRSAEFLISGASRITFGQVDSLSYSVSGASELSYHGSPVVSSKSCTGASTVKTL